MMRPDTPSRARLPIPSREGRGVRVREFWKRYARNRASVVGLSILLFFSLLAVGAPLLAPTSPFALGPHPFQSPQRAYPLGTDDLGRNILGGIIHGSRVSLLIGLLSVAASTSIGILVGALAGYFGPLEDPLMRITEFFLVIPAFVLALVLVALLRPSIWNVVLVIAVLGWPSTARLVRADFLSLKQREFVQAARAIGASDLRIIFKEVLPNALPPVVVSASLGVAAAILLESGLSFLGLGDPTKMSWGYLLGNARPFLRQAWWMPTFPGLAIFLTTLSLNLVGDGLNDALNPRLHQR